jgi:hypothetical protein
VLGRLGTAKALEAVRAAAKDSDADVQDAAIRALADWPNAAPLADLLAIAKADAKPARQVLALRGYVRLVGVASAPGTEKVGMFRQALALAKRPEEKKMVLAGTADAPSLESLEMAKGYLADADLKAEAAVAVIKIAAAIGGSDQDAAKAALKQVIAAPPGDAAKQQAQDALNSIEKNEDFITAWVVSGPYMQKDKDGAALFDVVFPPEGPDGAKAAWKPLPAGTIDAGAPGVVNLAKAVGGDNRVAYLRTAVYSPKAQAAQLELGSDDGIKVWLNGKVVHANNANRGMTPNEDKAKVSLNQGWNVLLLKVTNGGADWAASARVRAADGGRLEGLKFKADGM